MLHCQPCLADSAWADEGDCLRRARHVRQVGELGVAPENRRQRSCQVVAISGQHPQCRECIVESFTVYLPELHGVVEVADSIPAERLQGQVRWKLHAVGCVCRDDDLAAVAGVHHPRRLMHGEGHVVSPMRNRDTRVDAHSHTYLRGVRPRFGS